MVNLLFGNNYIYDIIGSTAGFLQQQRGLDTGEIGDLYSVASIPNIFMAIFIGYFIDSVGLDS